MMAAFVLDAMAVNTAFQNSLSNDIVEEHQKLWTRLQFRTMNDQICYDMRVISKQQVCPWSATAQIVIFHQGISV